MKLYKSLESALKDPKEVQALQLNVTDQKFPEEILNLPNLTELYIEGNDHLFPEEISSMKKLKLLTIRWRKLQNDFSSLLKLPKLTNLKIIETPLNSFLLPLGHTPAPITSLTIKDCGLKSLPEEISILWQLTDMNLSGNHLSDLPFGFIDLNLLKRLNLDSNDFQVFPDLIKRMPALSHLSIDHNKFAEVEKARIQREFHLWPN